MANIDSVHFQAPAPADKLTAEASNAVKSDTSNNLYDGAWETSKSIGRETQFAVGSIAGAATDALNHATTYDIAKSVGLGVVFGVVGARFRLPGLVKTATTAMVAGNVVSDALDNKWEGTFNAAADAWRSDKNLKTDIEVGQQGFGRTVVDNAGLLLGMKVGAKITGLSLSHLGLFRDTESVPANLLRRSLPGMTLPSTENGVANLSRPLEGDQYKYFAHSRSSAAPQIYRWPDNGKPLAGQELADVQRLDKSGEWHPNHREGLLREFTKGWFNEQTDQIAPGQTKATIEKWLGRK